MAEPIVGVVMGSDSDLPVMSQATEVLAELGIPAETRVVSAHRTPVEMLEYGQRAEERGLSVIIAGAGGAAHLPGMLAAVTSLPVIGVPVALKKLDGLDSLLSIVQMPKGVPVATVAIDGGRNAGLLAARILAVTDLDLRERLKAFARPRPTRRARPTPGSQPPSASRVSGAQDPRREHRGVPGGVDTDGRDRHPGRHLGDRSSASRPPAIEVLERQRDPDHRQVGVRGDDPGSAPTDRRRR